MAKISLKERFFRFFERPAGIIVGLAIIIATAALVVIKQRDLQNSNDVRDMLNAPVAKPVKSSSTAIKG